MSDENRLEIRRASPSDSIAVGLVLVFFPIAILVAAFEWTGSALLAATAGILPALFSDSADVIGVARSFLWIAPIGYGAYGVVMVMNASFNGMGYPMPGVAISVGRILVLYVPLALAGMSFFDERGVFAAYAAANILSGLIAYAWARNTARRACGSPAVASV